MAYNEKETPAKIFCLFHRKTDCNCIEPVTDNEKLITRFENAIRLNNILNRHEPDPPKLAAGNQEIESFQTRLIDLQPKTS